MRYLLIISVLLASCNSTKVLTKSKNNPFYFKSESPCRISKIMSKGKIYSEYEYDKQRKLKRINFFKEGENQLSHFINYDKYDRIASIDMYIFHPDTIHPDGYISSQVGKRIFKYKKLSTQLDVIKSFSGYFNKRDPFKKVKLRSNKSYYFKYDSNSKIIEVQKKAKRKSNRGSKILIQYDEKLNPIFVEFFSLATEKLVATITNEYDNSPNLEYEFFDFSNVMPVKSFNKLVSHEVKVFEGYHEKYSGQNSGHTIISLRWMYDYNENGLVQTLVKENPNIKSDEEKTINQYECNYVYICD